MALPSPAGIAKPRVHLLVNHRRASSSVTCCSYNGRSSEPDNGAAPSMDAADWRSFRAQLVLKKQYAKSVNPAVAAMPSQPSAKIAHKWAHQLVEPEKGCLLIATEKLVGSHIFERTVILLLSAGVLALVGVIVSLPSRFSRLKGLSFNRISSISVGPVRLEVATSAPAPGASVSSPVELSGWRQRARRLAHSRVQPTWTCMAGLAGSS